jgi:hypothetical protein
MATSSSIASCSFDPSEAFICCTFLNPSFAAKFFLAYLSLATILAICLMM